MNSRMPNGMYWWCEGGEDLPYSISFLLMRSSIFALLPFSRKPFLPPRRRKIHSTPFPAKAKNYARYLAPPLPTKSCDFAGPPDDGVFRHWYAGLLRAKLTRSDGVMAYFPSWWYLFRTVIHLCLSIDELTQVYTFLPPLPYIRKVGNPDGKHSISTLSELW